jgi:hypothetical protein
VLSDRARALVRWVERCGGALDYDAAAHEFLNGRGYYPEDFYSALAEALEGSALDYDGSLIVAGRVS